MIHSLRAITIVTFFALSSCQSSTPMVSYNDSEGWVSLFDGKSLKGWHGYLNEEIGAGWQIADGTFYLDKSKGEGGDLVTDMEFENFEFSLEWKIQDCGNSGIFFNIVEDPQYKYPWLTGPEMQILDDKCHPDAKIDTHRAGDLYDMIETSIPTVLPAGSWNSIKIRSMNGDMTFWQNGKEVVNFTMHNEDWDKMVAQSKFKSMPAFGKSKRGRIGLQDHGDMVWFRNLKVRVL